MARQRTMRTLVSAAMFLLLAQSAYAGESVRGKCVIFISKNVQRIHEILRPLAGMVLLECRSGVCRGAIDLDGIEIYHFESTSASPKELCAFSLQTFDMASSGSECEGELKVMRFNIDKPGRYGRDFRGTSIQVQFSTSAGFSPAKCIPVEYAQFDPGSIGISEVFDGSAARIEVSSY